MPRDRVEAFSYGDIPEGQRGAWATNYTTGRKWASSLQDLQRKGEIAPDVVTYVRSPRKYDWPDVDDGSDQAINNLAYLGQNYPQETYRKRNPKTGVAVGAAIRYKPMTRATKYVEGLGVTDELRNTGLRGRLAGRGVGGVGVGVGGVGVGAGVIGAVNREEDN
jgi:hypothetical protein